MELSVLRVSETLRNGAINVIDSPNQIEVLTMHLKLGINLPPSDS